MRRGFKFEFQAARCNASEAENDSDYCRGQAPERMEYFVNLAEEIEGKGFAFISSFLPELDTLSATSRMGEILNLIGVNQIQLLTPKKSEDSTPNTYSGIYGLGEFPMHTDLAHWDTPPRYLALRCIVGDPLVKTRLIDFYKASERFGINNLRRLLVQPRRPLCGRRSLLSVLDIKEGHQKIYRWDPVFIEPATTISESIYVKIREAIACEEAMDFALERPGDTLVIDNWRMLHGRSPVHDKASGRRIERIYMSGIKEGF